MSVTDELHAIADEIKSCIDAPCNAEIIRIRKQIKRAWGLLERVEVLIVDCDNWENEGGK